MRLSGVPVPSQQGTGGTTNAKACWDTSYAKLAGNGLGTQFSSSNNLRELFEAKCCFEQVKRGCLEAISIANNDRSPFPIYKGTERCDAPTRVPEAQGVDAFVGAGRRSLALSERSELASDGRATEKASTVCLCWRVPEQASGPSFPSITDAALLQYTRVAETVFRT